MKLNRFCLGLVTSLFLIGSAYAIDTSFGSQSVTEINPSLYANRLFHQLLDPVAGNPKGTVTLVEFFDYQCQHCIDMAPVVDNLLASDHKLRIVFKELPFRGPISEFAARVALAAKQQGKYLVFHEALMHAAQQPLTNESILELAKTNGLDVEQIKKDMNSPLINQQINDNLKLAQDLRVQGTPAFFIGKTMAPAHIVFILGDVPQLQLESLIKKTS